MAAAVTWNQHRARPCTRAAVCRERAQAQRPGQSRWTDRGVLPTHNFEDDAYGKSQEIMFTDSVTYRQFLARVAK
jgi:hypothetical protein